MVNTWRNTENSDFSGSQEVNEWHPSLYLQTLPSLAVTSTMTGSNFYCLFWSWGGPQDSHMLGKCVALSQPQAQSHFWTEWLSPSAAVSLSPNSSVVVQDLEQVTELNGPVSSSIKRGWKARWQCWWRWCHPLCMATLKTEWVNKHAATTRQESERDTASNKSKGRNKSIIRVVGVAHWQSVHSPG